MDAPDADAYIHDARKILLSHAVPDAESASLPFFELPVAGRGVVLVNSDDALHAVERVNQLALHRVAPCKAGRVELVLDDDPDVLVRVIVIAAQADAEQVSSVLSQGVGVQPQCVVAFPSIGCHVAVLVEYGVGVAA